MEPGVYLFKDAKASVIYVGKAKSLRTRVRQYFREGGDERFFIAAGFFGKAVADVETIVVSSSKEALLLENHLIKKHQPKFNVKLRDDKQYLVLRLVDPKPPVEGEVTPKRELFPRVEVVRNIRDDHARYFGPYHSATSARETLRSLNRHFQLRTCTDHVLANRTRPCILYQIKRCPAPCVLPIDPAGYAEQVEAAGQLEYERAGQIRDQIYAVEKTLTRQTVVSTEKDDQDAVGFFRNGDVV